MKDINVFGPIGDGWSADCTTASDFARALKEAGGDDVTIHINSGGGDVFDANTMAETLRNYAGKSVASIEGLAASAASYFALTADEVVINPSALVMIHNPWSLAYGSADDMRKTADMLDKARSTISRQYARKTGREVGEIEALMDEEAWFDAEEAVELGLADRLSDEGPIAACVDADMLARFKHAPAGLSTAAAMPCGATAAPAGDAGATIRPTTGEPETGAVEGDTGAVSRVVCVNGAFLRVEGKTR